MLQKVTEILTKRHPADVIGYGSRSKARRRFWLALGMIAGMAMGSAACTPRVQSLAETTATPALHADHFISLDGARLPLSAWQPEAQPRAILIGVHGFNDYRMTFRELGPALAAKGIAVYAYDQRGFGQAPRRGIWAAPEALAGDLATLTTLLRRQHPDLPLAILGNSMGAAVTLVAAARRPLPVDGVILSAPAVWGGEAMSPFYRGSLWLAAHTMPWNYATGRSLRIMPSDNIEMLRALGRDEHIIRKTRIDAVYGLVSLMGAAQAAADNLHLPTLVLYGRKDEIIPAGAVARLYDRLPADKRLVIYEKGFHMVLRDLQAATVYTDLAAWIFDPNAPLPSGEEVVE